LRHQDRSPRSGAAGEATAIVPGESQLPLSLTTISGCAMIPVKTSAAGSPKTSFVAASVCRSSHHRRTTMMKPRQGPHPLWKTPDGFAATHCTQCKAGWTRTGSQGER
jgi:hypothetical protein